MVSRGNYDELPKSSLTPGPVTAREKIDTHRPMCSRMHSTHEGEKPDETASVRTGPAKRLELPDVGLGRDLDKRAEQEPVTKGMRTDTLSEHAREIETRQQRIKLVTRQPKDSPTSDIGGCDCEGGAPVRWAGAAPARIKGSASQSE